MIHGRQGALQNQEEGSATYSQLVNLQRWISPGGKKQRRFAQIERGFSYGVETSSNVSPTIGTVLESVEENVRARSMSSSKLRSSSRLKHGTESGFVFPDIASRDQEERFNPSSFVSVISSIA